MSTISDTARGAINTQGRKSNNSTGNSAQSQSAHKLKPGTKQFRVLDRLVVRPLHRFDAEKFPVSDHTLPSTISELRKRYGLNFEVTMIELPGYAGKGARVAQYALTEESWGKAMVLVGLA